MLYLDSFLKNLWIRILKNLEFRGEKSNQQKHSKKIKLGSEMKYESN